MSSTQSFRLHSLFFCLALLASGCVSFSRDASDEASLWGGYTRNADYQLLEDVFITRVDDGLFSHKRVLVPAAIPRRVPGRHYQSPESIEAYRQNPQAFTGDSQKSPSQVMDVVGIVPASTRLRCTELRYRSGWTFMTGSFKDLTPSAQILDGEFAGTTVDITDVSIYYRPRPGDVFRYRPEDGVIEAVDR